jgi:SEC-C motif
MTLLLCLANQDQVILASDRRLTRNGLVENDEFNKAVVLTCRDAQLAVAFTGLAAVDLGPNAPGFDTGQWILEALMEAAPPDYLMEPLINRLCDKTTKQWAKLRVADKRLTVIFTGYSFADDPPRIYHWVISNFEDQEGHERDTASERFEAHFRREIRPSEADPFLVRAYGTHSGLAPEDTEALSVLLQQRKPAAALVGKTIEVMRRAADSPRSGGKVGKQYSTVVMPRDPKEMAVGEYHSEAAATKVYSVDRVRVGDHGCYAIREPSVELRDGAKKPLVVPRTGRNKPCPCGSGKKYKKCHGRQRPPRLRIKL